jgi:hypothetical protein
MTRTGPLILFALVTSTAYSADFTTLETKTNIRWLPSLPTPLEIAMLPEVE